MGKGSIIYEVIQAFEGLKAFGESKLEARKRIAEETGQKLRYVQSPKIHSVSTWETYRRWSLQCATWCRQSLGVRHLRDLQPEHAAAYLKYLKEERRYSAWSLKSIRSALAKLLKVPGPSLGDVGTRRLRDIKRSRCPVAMDKDFSPAGKYCSFVDFAKATGCRAFEARRVKVKDVQVLPDGRVFVHVERGKGGQPRDLEVLKSREHAVLRARDAALKAGGGPEAKLFGWVPKKVKFDEHAVCAAYFWSIYKQYEDLSRPRKFLLVRRNGEVFDKVALMRAAEYGGHHRLSVMVKHYLWNRSHPASGSPSGI